MSSRARRLAWPAALLAPTLVAALPTPVTALEPVTGVLFDGRVRVLVRSVDGSPQGLETPISGAAVTLIAYRTDFPEEAPIGGPVTGMTGPDGSVELAGVARPADQATVVHLAVDAMRRTESTDADGCLVTEVWAGNVPDLTSPPPDPVVVPATRVETRRCPDRPVLEGRLLDAGGDPLVVREATVAVSTPGDPGRTVPLAVGADGGFLTELPAVGTWLQPATVSLRALGARTRDEPYGAGCVRTWGQSVSWSTDAALAEGATLPWLELTAVESVMGERCGAVSTRPPASPAPTGVPARGQEREVTPRQPVATGRVEPVPAPSQRPETTQRPDPTRPAASIRPSAGAVAARTAAPAPTRAPDAAGAGATTPAAPAATPELVALLVALVAMAVTLAIVIRISRRT